jgi:hypothetical protein
MGGIQAKRSCQFSVSRVPQDQPLQNGENPNRHIPSITISFYWKAVYHPHNAMSIEISYMILHLEKIT